MKPQSIVKVSPIAEVTMPTLLQCKTGTCGGCPNGTGKLLWFPNPAASGSFSVTLNFQYNFFDKSAESSSAIKYNTIITGENVNGVYDGQLVSYSLPPSRTWATNTHAYAANPALSPSLMKGTLKQSYTFSFTNSGWICFRQPNPALSNVHDALCFEYNREKQLVTFRSF